jgi:hypothetical protein
LNRSRPAPIVHFLRQKDNEMQIRSKAYEHFISICRSFRDRVSPHDQSVPAQTSSSLVFTTVVLALLLTILEIDLHRTELHLVGLMNETDAINFNFMGS